MNVSLGVLKMLKTLGNDTRQKGVLIAKLSTEVKNAMHLMHVFYIITRSQTHSLRFGNNVELMPEAKV